MQFRVFSEMIQKTAPTLCNILKFNKLHKPSTLIVNPDTAGNLDQLKKLRDLSEQKFPKSILSKQKDLSWL